MSPPGGPEPFDDDLYDEATRAAIEGWVRPATARGPAGLTGWRRTSASGAVLGAALLGLGDALEGRRPRDQPPLVTDDRGQPEDPAALVEVDFDPTSPRSTVARLRHLRGGRVGREGGGDRLE